MKKSKSEFKNSPDWTAVARSLGLGKYVSKELSYFFKENSSWAALRDRDFLRFFEGIIQLDIDVCGAGCCTSQRIVGPNGWVEFYLLPAGHWVIDHGSFNDVPGYFESSAEWLSCHKLRLRMVRQKRKQAAK